MTICLCRRGICELSIRCSWPYFSPCGNLPSLPLPALLRGMLFLGGSWHPGQLNDKRPPLRSWRTRTRVHHRMDRSKMDRRDPQWGLDKALLAEGKGGQA